MRDALLVSTLVLGLSGCGPQPQTGAVNDTRGRIFDTQRIALDKSKSVGDTVMQADRSLRAQEEAQAK